MNNLSKWTNIGKIASAVIGVVACLFLFGGPNTNVNDAAEVAAFRDGAQMSFATFFTIFLLAACVALVLIFFVAQLISNPKKTIMSIIGLVAALVIYLVVYMMGTSDTDESLNLVSSIGSVSKSTITSTTAGLWTVFIGLMAVVVVIVGFSVKKLLNR